MSYYRAFNSVLKLPKTTVATKRSVSEYAKKFGYKLKTPDMEVRVKPLKNFLFMLGGTLLLADIAWDKQIHYETFMKHFDETKKYYKPELHFGFLASPNMEFLVEDSNREYKDKECIPVTKARIYPDLT